MLSCFNSNMFRNKQLVIELNNKSREDCLKKHCGISQSPGCREWGQLLLSTLLVLGSMTKFLAKITATNTSSDHSPCTVDMLERSVVYHLLIKRLNTFHDTEDQLQLIK